MNENQMGTLSEGRLLLKMSIPMILSVLVQSLYSLVDSIFVGRLGESALTAISLATPMATIMLSLAFGLSIGVNALLSQKLGEGDKKAVNRTAGNGFTLEIIACLVFMLIGLFGTRLFFSMQTGSIEIQDLGVSYLSIIMIFSLGLMIQTLAERLCASTGKTIGCMLILSSGAIINLILDPIMIFGMFGFPAMGITGAALATVIGQWVAAIIGVLYNLFFNKEIIYKFKYMLPDFKIMKQVITIAIPATLTYALTSVLAFGINMILIGFTTTAPAVYIVYVRIQGFVVMPVWGIRNTLVSIVAYNYGANKKDRIIRTIRLATITSVIVMILGTVLFIAIPSQLLSVFNASSAMLEIGIPALRIISTTFVLTAVTTIFGGVFQALNNSSKAFWIAFMQAVVLLGSAFLIGLYNQLTLVWLAFPISEIVVFIMAVYFMRQVYVRMIKDKEDSLEINTQEIINAS